MNYGYIPDVIQPENLVLGGVKQLGGEILVPDGQWDGWLPENEFQNLNGIEPYACVSFATLNIVEILERREYGASNNWSDRFLAVISGTRDKMGNSPQTVGETLRKQGVVPQADWPFDETIKSFDSFYANVSKELRTLALAFTGEYSFGHEWVPSNVDSIIEALKYSPVGFSAYAWVKDGETYYRPQGMSDNHFCVCYGYEYGKYWKIFDSYSADGSALKKIRWDSLPMQAKRYTLHRQVVVESAWDRFMKLIREILGL